MKKISQAIIGATLILDVAVVFTFGLVVISSFEDGSRLPETTFVRKSAEGRVAGEMTSTCPSVPNLKIEMPAEGAAVTTSPFGIHAVKIPGTTLPTLTSVRFVPTATAYQNIPATYTQVNMSWVADVSITAYQIQNGPFSFRAEGFDNQGNCIARSDSRHVAINYTSTDSLLVPSVSIISPAAGVIFGIKEISGTLSNFPTSYSLPIKELQVWQGTTLKKSFSLTRDASNPSNLIGNFDTATLANGDYTIKIHLEYNDGISNKTLDSGPINITVSNANMVGDNPIAQPVPSIALSAPLGGTISGSVSISGILSNLPTSYSIPVKELQVWQGTILKNNFTLTRDANGVTGSMDTATLANGDYTIKIHLEYNDGISNKTLDSGPVSVTVNNANTAASNDTPTDTSSTSSTSTDSTTSTTDNTSTGTSGSTGTTTPPPAGTTATTLTVAITNPAPSTTPIILRSKDNPLAAKTSAAVSGLKFIVHKAGEPVTQFIPIDAVSSDQINWKANMSLTIFNDGEYDITAVVGGIKSAPVNVIVQRFDSNWINPAYQDHYQELPEKTSIKAKIDGIYEKDGITPASGVKVYFYQTTDAVPHSEIYKERIYQKPGTHEWRLYDWTSKTEKFWKTTDSFNGKYGLTIKIFNESISLKEPWFSSKLIFVKINNQQAVLPSSNTNVSVSGANNNQNLNAAATNTVAANTAVSNTSNTAVAQNVNSTNNTNADAVQNSNTANDSSAVVAQIDSDQDRVSDADEQARGTNPNSVDTDKDGLTDFKEVDFYKTDPLKDDTDGDGYLDGEEVQSLHDPLKQPTDPMAAILLKPKPVEEPKAFAKPILESLVVEKIENKEIKTTPPPSTNETNSQASTSGITENTIVLKGKGPANTILTLFIYSEDPIVVTVRTNENGEWIYELDKTLEDGEHEVYATITDDTGKIESTSSPMKFLVKQARAETIPERADTGIDSVPGSSSTNLYLLISGIMVFIAIVAGFIIALRRKRGDTNQMT